MGSSEMHVDLFLKSLHSLTLHFLYLRWTPFSLDPIERWCFTMPSEKALTLPWNGLGGFLLGLLSAKLIMIKIRRQGGLRGVLRNVRLSGQLCNYEQTRDNIASYLHRFLWYQNYNWGAVWQLQILKKILMLNVIQTSNQNNSWIIKNQSCKNFKYRIDNVFCVEARVGWKVVNVEICETSYLRKVVCRNIVGQFWM